MRHRSLQYATVYTALERCQLNLRKCKVSKDDADVGSLALGLAVWCKIFQLLVMSDMCRLAFP